MKKPDELQDEMMARTADDAETPPEAPTPLAAETLSKSGQAKVMASMIQSLTNQQKSVLVSMMKFGWISFPHVLAADRWYQDYAAAIFGAAGGCVSSGGGAAGLMRQEGAVAASESYRGAKAALGTLGNARMRGLFELGLTIPDLAHKLGIPATIAAGMVAADLGRLAEHYWPAN